MSSNTEGLDDSVRQRRPNHLIHEKSPYLLQHARNPVDWRPWGSAAFDKARREGKPVFLSIGYSTCHWCHVMERESFENPKIARLLNRHFVSVKVDREERPDIDKIYMTTVMAMTGSGGWPLSVFLTPDLKPFFGGTYFPPEARGGQPGFGQILERLAQIWISDKDRIDALWSELRPPIISRLSVEGNGSPVDAAIFDEAFLDYERHYIPSAGGFSPAPKFPMPVDHFFLLRYFARSGNPKALDMTVHTLRQMARGGIFDHLGGGFHRYSTDDRWHVPHFEKMLYDNAQIAVCYLEAFQLTRDPSLSEAATRTLDYVLRDLAHPAGGFYGAEDADSLPAEFQGKATTQGYEHKREGAFYVWRRDEILKILGPEVGEMFSFRYGVRPEGNADSDPPGEFEGQNILSITRTLAETGDRFHKTPQEAEEILEGARKQLLAARNRRPRPERDDKILTSWNGLMISALAKGYQVLEDPRYLAAAVQAARFIRLHLYDPASRRLYRRWRQGEKNILGMAEDYAFLVQGLIDLYEASFDISNLEWAIELAEQQNTLFYDDKNGGFFMTELRHDPALLVRSKESSDHVEPAASSVAVLNLLRLAQYADRADFRKAAQQTLKLFGDLMKERPRSLAQLLTALDFFLSKPRQIVIAGDPAATDTRAMLQAVRRRFLPNKTLILADGGKDQEVLAHGLSFLKEMIPIDGKATAYICTGSVCDLPTHDLTKVKRSLGIGAMGLTDEGGSAK